MAKTFLRTIPCALLRSPRNPVRCTRDDDGMLCSCFFLVLIVILFLSSAYHQQTDTALGRLLRTLKTRVHRPLDHPPVTVHPPRENRQDDPARRVYKPPCVNAQVTQVCFPQVVTSHITHTGTGRHKGGPETDRRRHQATMVGVVQRGGRRQQRHLAQRDNRTR